MKHRVSPELAAMPTRLAALLAGEPDKEMDEVMDEAEYDDGLWDGEDTAVRDEGRYFYRLEVLASDILGLIHRDSGAPSQMEAVLAWQAAIEARPI